MRDLVFAAPWEGKQRDKSETGKRLRGKFTCRLKVGGRGIEMGEPRSDVH